MKKRMAFSFIIIAYIAFVVFSFSSGNENGQRIIQGLINFTKQMILLLPFAFVLVGLFEVWIKKETVERYLGLKTGFMAYFLAIALAGTTVGGLYVAFPLAYSLHRKGAKLAVVFTYLGAAGICRIPMTVFEASFLGIKFTLVRFIVSLPLVVFSSWLIGGHLTRREYAFKEPKLTMKGTV